MVENMNGKQRLKEELTRIFSLKFAPGILLYYHSPGRVNLIGEHIDYNGGKVLPCAISKGTTMAIAPRRDRQVQVYSANFPSLGIISFSLDSIELVAEDSWANYVKGIFWVLQGSGAKFKHGYDIGVIGDLPTASGLSSSASIELLIAYALNDMNGLAWTREELAVLAQKAENSFNQLNCGIMDQFIIATASADNAILLDCDSLSYRYVPLQLQDYRLLIADTKKPRQLIESKYNERFSECQEALSLLKNKFNIAHLAELDLDLQADWEKILSTDKLKSRVRHVVTENKRTSDAVKFLEAARLEEFGALLNASHESLRYDYEVSGVHLDSLVSSMQKQTAVLGARMTGAGFGGCSIAIAHKDAIQDIIAKTSADYEKKLGIKPEFYSSTIAQGVHKL